MNLIYLESNAQGAVTLKEYTPTPRQRLIVPNTSLGRRQSTSAKLNAANGQNYVHPAEGAASKRGHRMVD
jgi:hypothetical protein